MGNFVWALVRVAAAVVLTCITAYAAYWLAVLVYCIVYLVQQ